MPGRINNVDTMLRELLFHSLPETGCCRGGDGNSPLLLLLHPVHGRGPVMDFTDLVRNTGVIKYAFGRCRFAGIDMGHDAEIAITINWCRTRHDLFLFPVPSLPAVVRKGLVGFSHTMRIFTLLDS